MIEGYQAAEKPAGLRVSGVIRSARGCWREVADARAGSTDGRSVQLCELREPRAKLTGSKLTGSKLTGSKANGVRTLYGAPSAALRFADAACPPYRCRRSGLPCAQPGQRQGAAVRLHHRLSLLRAPAGRRARPHWHAAARLVPDAQPLAPRPLAAGRRRSRPLRAPAHPAAHPSLPRPPRHARPGSSLPGPLQGVLVQDDAHLLAVCRYVERNPLRAGLVPAAGDWPHGSLAQWRRRGAARLVDPWPLPRPAGWAALVDRPETPQELAALRGSAQRGAPMAMRAGRPRWPTASACAPPCAHPAARHAAGRRMGKTSPDPVISPDPVLSPSLQL